jgi:ketosteroid isomerase-like protein
MTANEQSVVDVLSAYSQALNASDTNAVMPLYARDGVFMPPYSPSAVGWAEVRKAYDAVFAAIKLTVKFHVAEIVEMSPEWVFARTNSEGTTLNHATGATSKEANQELFIFHKEKGGNFKIARYSFSTTNPRQA